MTHETLNTWRYGVPDMHRPAYVITMIADDLAQAIRDHHADLTATWKMIPFDDVIMGCWMSYCGGHSVLRPRLSKDVISSQPYVTPLVYQNCNCSYLRGCDVWDGWQLHLNGTRDGKVSVTAFSSVYSTSVKVNSSLIRVQHRDRWLRVNSTTIPRNTPKIHNGSATLSLF